MKKHFVGTDGWLRLNPQRSLVDPSHAILIYIYRYSICICICRSLKDNGKEDGSNSLRFKDNGELNGQENGNSSGNWGCRGWIRMTMTPHAKANRQNNCTRTSNEGQRHSAVSESLFRRISYREQPHPHEALYACLHTGLLCFLRRQ